LKHWLTVYKLGIRNVATPTDPAHTRGGLIAWECSHFAARYNQFGRRLENASITKPYDNSVIETRVNTRGVFSLIVNSLRFPGSERDWRTELV
jgi:hypothetical protein